MRSILQGLIITTAALFLATGCSSGGHDEKAAGKVERKSTVQAKMTGDPARGKKIYEKYCYYCHGRKGMGDGPIGTAITPHPADFVHDRKRMARTDEELFRSITEGIRRPLGGEEMAMPRWADILTVQDRWDVLAYVRQLERKGLEAEKGK